MRYSRVFGLIALMLLALALPAARLVFAEDPRPPVLLVEGAPSDNAPLGAESALAGATVAAANGLVRVGRPANLPVQVTNVQRLGAATIEIGFDPARLKPLSCQRSAVFDVGFCNLKLDSDSDGRADTVKFNALSVTGVSIDATPIVLAGIVWQAVTPLTIETTTTLRVKVVTFTDVDGFPMPATPQDGRITLLPVRIRLPFVQR